MRWSLLLSCLLPLFVHAAEPGTLAPIRVNEAGTGFVAGKQPTVLRGFNYDHDRDSRLLEDYWFDEWDVIVEDFREMKALGGNVVRIHLQLPKFMDSKTQPNEANLKQLRKLVELAEQTGLYLNLTGLGCYHKADVPAWYDALSDVDRWQVQANFWQSVAEIGRGSSSIFCYDLMNEPILPGKQGDNEWLTGELGGKHFVQRISLDLAGRTREEVASAWVRTLTDAIREVDSEHLITVGVIPWANVWPNAKPIFHGSQVGQPLDFVSVHFYPKAGEVEKSLAALKVYELGKPLVVEEFFPLKCSLEETREFVAGAKPIVDGWVSFYWGATADEYAERDDLPSKMIGGWLKVFPAMIDEAY